MIDVKYLDAIKSFEGFTPRAKWDYAQSSNGYGTKALYDGEVIDRTEADRRFKAEIKAAYEIVDRFAPQLDDGSKAALTSLTYNAGTAWTKSGLGSAIRAGDIEAAKEIFLQYNKAGGAVLPGLAARRDAEMAWFDTSNAGNQRNPFEAITVAELNAPNRIDDSGLTTAAMANAPASEMANVSPLPSYRSMNTTVESSHGDSNAPILRHDATLTLAAILSILSMSHLNNGAPESKDDENQIDVATNGSKTYDV